MLWIVYAESANYAGYGNHCVVEADSKLSAAAKAKVYFEALYYEEDYDNYANDNGDLAADLQSTWAEVKTVDLLNEQHKLWPYYINPSQASFYPRIN